MLKPSTNRATTSRSPPSTSHNLLMDTGYQAPANPPQSGSPENWHAFVNGGAQADDAQLLQKRREEEAAYQEARRNVTPQPAATDVGPSTASGKLIQISPRKPSGSVNTGLLVDLEVDDSYGAYSPQQPRDSYASAACYKSTRNGGPENSLLD